MNILFIEDNFDFAYPLIEFAIAMGHKIDHTENLIDAANKFKEYNYDAVITDIHLRKADSSSLTSGLDLVRFIRDKRKSNVIIAITTGLELLKESDIKEHGADIFHYKPLRMGYEAFINEINDLFLSRQKN